MTLPLTVTHTRPRAVHNLVGLLCGGYLVLIVLAAVFAPWLTPYAQEGAGTPNMANKLLPPSVDHPLGADAMGRDVLARVLYGGRTALGTAAIVVGSSLLVGIALGLVAGYRGGLVDEVAMRVTDVFLAFPPLLLSILLLAVLGGMSVFGPIGFIVGPVIVSLFKVLLELYAAHVRDTAVPSIHAQTRSNQ